MFLDPLHVKGDTLVGFLVCSVLPFAANCHKNKTVTLKCSGLHAQQLQTPQVGSPFLTAVLLLLWNSLREWEDEFLPTRQQSTKPLRPHISRVASNSTHRAAVSLLEFHREESLRSIKHGKWAVVGGGALRFFALEPSQVGTAGPVCVPAATDGSPRRSEPNFPSPPGNSRKWIPLTRY